MSEPVSNVEIEDVLSSIRRLVSDENRPTSRRESKEVPYKPTRLVLTPSLLVPVSSEPEDAIENPVATDSDGDATDSRAEVEETEEALHTPAETVDSAQADDDGHADADPAPDDHADSDRLDPSEFEPAEQDSSDPSTAPWDNPDATLFKAAETAEPTDDWQPDDSEAPRGEDSLAAVETPAEELVAPEVHSDETPVEEAHVALDREEDEQVESSQPAEDALESQEGQSRADDPGDGPGNDSDPGDSGEPNRTATLSAKIAALEAQIGQTSDQWEPDGELGDDYAGTRVETIEWQDHDAGDDAGDTGSAETGFAPTEPEETGESAEVVDGDATEPDTADGDAGTATQATMPEDRDDDVNGDMLDLLAGDDAILDEESLRELVADIVRQELQGALGERITRNVRKLVRREIHRALTAQELE